MDAEELYIKMRQFAEDEGGFVSDEADEMIARAAEAIAGHPSSQ